MEYVEKILKRIGDANLGDRLVGPVNLAKEYGLLVDNLVQGIVAAFMFGTAEDEQSVELQQKVKSLGIAKVAAEITGLRREAKCTRKLWTLIRAYSVRRITCRRTSSSRHCHTLRQSLATVFLRPPRLVPPSTYIPP